MTFSVSEFDDHGVTLMGLGALRQSEARTFKMHDHPLGIAFREIVEMILKTAVEHREDFKSLGNRLRIEFQECVLAVSMPPRPRGKG